MGVTSAYLLARSGHEVVLLERRSGTGLETSFANGSLLTPSMAEPWNSPGCWRVLLSSIGRSDAALQVRIRALPGLAGWGVSFLRNSAVSSYQRSALSNLRLALYSSQVLRELRESLSLEYGREARGTLRLFRSPEMFARADLAARRLESEGLAHRSLSGADVSALEPALAPLASQLAGAIHYPGDETGNAHRFCTAMTEHARREGVEFRLDTVVTSIETRAGQVTGLICGSERLVGDKYVVAAGSYSTPLLRTAGVELPVRPAKGYSISFPRAYAQPPLTTPVVDDERHAVVVPLEGGLRIAGAAEFVGYNLSLDPIRIRKLLEWVREVIPQERFDASEARPWCGLRPMSADGVPIIGPTHLPNLLVNAGHGHLGWTLVAGSCQLLADIVCGGTPAVDADLFSLTRFAAARRMA